MRRWLVDYLVAEVGCAREDVETEVALSDLGVGSRDVVVLSGELSELLGRPVSPLDFWQHPSINELVAFLADTDPALAGESECDAGRVPDSLPDV